jgi:hypothetical protein
MTLSILVDMNLSPEWVQLLEKAGFPAVHWSNLGMADSEDRELMAWAIAHKHVVFTRFRFQLCPCADACRRAERDSAARPESVAGTCRRANSRGSAAV